MKPNNPFATKKAEVDRTFAAASRMYVRDAKAALDDVAAKLPQTDGPMPLEDAIELMAAFRVHGERLARVSQSMTTSVEAVTSRLANAKTLGDRV